MQQHMPLGDVSNNRRGKEAFAEALAARVLFERDDARRKLSVVEAERDITLDKVAAAEGKALQLERDLASLQVETAELRGLARRALDERDEARDRTRSLQNDAAILQLDRDAAVEVRALV